MGSYTAVSKTYMVILLGIFILGLFPQTPQAENPLDRFVLGENSLPQFKITRWPKYYRPESLWNYINGGALPYLDYGVGDVVTYAGIWEASELEIVVDIYDMSNNLGAFGIYSNERFPDYTYLDIGVEGYITENALCFWKDRYYVKVFSQDDSPSTLEPIKNIARNVADRIPDGEAMPRLFTLFPEQNRLIHTESYLAKNVLGQEFLSNAYAVNYVSGEEEYQFYVIQAPDKDEAGKWLSLYGEFLNEYGESEIKEIPLGEKAFVGQEGWYGTMIFVQKGKYILASVGFSDMDQAQNNLKSMMSGLSSGD